MATPSGARHRDSEQRFLDLESAVRNLAAASLRRRQLGVTEGDFAVTGGGSVVVDGGGGIVINDGGTFRTEYPGGQEAIRFGPITPSALYDHGLLMFDESGAPQVWFIQRDDGAFESVIGGDTINVNSAGDLNMFAGGGDLYLNGDRVHILHGTDVRIGHDTTGSAANCHITTDGRIYRVSSSLRYKTDVSAAEVDPAAVLSLQGRTWVDKASEDDQGARRHVGFIAEELDAAGLTDFVDYDDEGRPDAIQYDRLSVGLLAVVKSQQAQLDALSARLDALEGVA